MTKPIVLAELSRAIAGALPPALQSQAPALAALLAELAAGRVTPVVTAQRLADDPQLVAVLQALAGQSIAGGAVSVQLSAPAPAPAAGEPASVTLRIVSTGGGDYAEGIIDKRQGTFVEVPLYLGEPLALRQQRLNRARQVLIDEILAQISHLDARLAFVAATHTPDTLEPRLAALRQQIAPAAAHAAAAGYRQLLTTQRIGALRQALNSHPLATRLSPALIDLLVQQGLAVDGLHFLYDQLVQVQDASESLLDVLANVAGHIDAAPALHTYDTQRIVLAVRVVRNRTQTAYSAGLRALHQLIHTPGNSDQTQGGSDTGADILTVQTSLTQLTQLTPRHLADPAATHTLLVACFNEAAALMAERAALAEQGQHLLEQSLDSYAELEALVAIEPTDPWQVVIGKARALRDLGRTADAVAAFGRYAAMFAASDPTAAAYAQVAQQFTMQCAALGVSGGAYLYEVAPAGAADQAGLAIGDIIVGYGERVVATMPDMVAALQDATTRQLVRVSYLRRDAQGRFMPQITTIAGGPIGAGLLPV